MNGWSNPDALPEAEACQMAAFLETRAQMPDQQRLHAALIDAFAPVPGEYLLDLGCGSGTISRRLAEKVGPTGSVLGIDISAVMIREAQKLSSHAALQFAQGDATALPYDPAAFDGATAARLLLHVPDQPAVLRELRRVVRPGGRIGLLEWDWGTVAIDHSQRNLTRRILDWRCDNHGGENWMGRQLVRSCHQAGWRVRIVQGLVSLVQDEDSGFVATLRRAGQGAVQHQAITQEEYAQWIDEIDHRLAEHTFFASINDYLVVAH